MPTKRKLAEQVRLALGNKPTMQECILATNQAYGYVVRTNWWTSKNEGLTDVNGNFIYAFDNNDILKDTNKNLYYSIIPSSFLGNIPHEMGIPHVSYQHSYNKPFIRLTNGQPALFRGLQSENMEGNDTFFVENDKIYLPTIDIKVSCTAKLLIKLVVALEGIDDETNILIPPDLQWEIVNMAISLYSQKQNDNPVISSTVEAGRKP